MTGERRPRKRPAFEPVARLAARSSADPSMRRPAATVAGSILVLLRAAAGALWGLSIAWGFPAWIGEAAALFGGDSGDSVPEGGFGADTPLVLLLVAVVCAVQVVFGILLLFGSDPARVTVMIISVISISSSFVGWWELDQEITVRTSLITLSLDILVLLALSSRSAAAYARRPRRRVPASRSGG